MTKRFYKSWGFTDKACVVCGDKNKFNQFIQPSTREFTGSLCSKCLGERIERFTADDDDQAGSQKDAGVDKPVVQAGGKRIA